MGDGSALRAKQNITAFIKRAVDTLRAGEIRKVGSVILGRAATTFIVALESKAEKDATAILHGAQRRQADDVPQQLMDGRLRRTKKPDVLPR